MYMWIWMSREVHARCIVLVFIYILAGDKRSCFFVFVFVLTYRWNLTMVLILCSVVLVLCFLMGFVVVFGLGWVVAGGFRPLSLQYEDGT